VKHNIHEVFSSVKSKNDATIKVAVIEAGFSKGKYPWWPSFKTHFSKLQDIKAYKIYWSEDKKPVYRLKPSKTRARLIWLANTIRDALNFLGYPQDEFKGILEDPIPDENEAYLAADPRAPHVTIEDVDEKKLLAGIPLDARS